MAGANSNMQITDLDFNSIKNNLKTFLQSQDTLKDYNYEGSALSTILDILAYNTQYNAYYLNMVANEMFLDTAIQRDSVVSQAKLLNYTPKSAIAPGATINLTVNQVTDASLTLPKFTHFLSEAIDGVNYNFVTADSTTVNTVNNQAIFTDVTIKQGIPVTLSYVVDTTTNPKTLFKIPETNVDTTTLQVIVQQSSSNNYSTVYTRSTDYLTLDGSSAVYFLQEGLGGCFEVYFGDGILGQALNNGNIVRLSYVTTQGTFAAGANNFVLMDSISGYANTAVTPLTAASQGSERESISSIKLHAPQAYAAQGRAVTKNDYIATIQEKNPGAYDSISVWGGQENSPPVYGQVFIAIKPKGGYLLTDTEKQRLVADVIKPISIMTVDPTIVDPDYTYLQLTAKVLYDPKKTTATAAQIQAAVKSSINSLATSSLNTFNSTFQLSDFNNVINSSDPSIITNEIQLQVQKKIMPNLSTPTTYNLYFGVPLKKGMFMSGINSSPAIQYRNPLNLANVIDGLYIEEIPSSTGGIETISVINPGYGYSTTDAPTVTVLGDGTGATAVAEVSGDGRIKSITVTNKGSGYTAAIIKITPASNDTTGTLAAAVANLEGRYGTLRAYYNDTNNVKVVFKDNIGTIDYVEGLVTLKAFNPIEIDNPLGQLTITATPTTSIISSTYNRIITIDPFDPNSIIVNVTAKT